MREILLTYELMTPESAEEGDFSERGYTAPGGWDFPIPEGLVGEAFAKWRDSEVTPAWSEESSRDIDDTLVASAVKFLIDNGYTEPSSSDYQPGSWYSWPDWSVEDYSTGEERMQSAHLSGFTVDEEREIGKKMQERTRRVYAAPRA